MLKGLAKLASWNIKLIKHTYNMKYSIANYIVMYYLMDFVYNVHNFENDNSIVAMIEDTDNWVIEFSAKYANIYYIEYRYSYIAIHI